MQDERPARHPTGLPGSGLHGKRAVTDALVSLIERESVENGYEPGHLLGRRKDLLERFGVAPATLSAALRVLSSRGVIDVRPGPRGGIFFARQPPLTRLANDLLAIDPDEMTLSDCCTIASALDQKIERDAIRHRTEGDIQDVGEILRHLESAWNDPARAELLAWRLRGRIAAITPNIALRAIYGNLVELIVIRLEPITDSSGLVFVARTTLADYQALVEAITNGAAAQ